MPPTNTILKMLSNFHQMLTRCRPSTEYCRATYWRQRHIGYRRILQKCSHAGFAFRWVDETRVTMTCCDYERHELLTSPLPAIASLIRKAAIPLCYDIHSDRVSMKSSTRRRRQSILRCERFHCCTTMPRRVFTAALESLIDGHRMT